MWTMHELGIVQDLIEHAREAMVAERHATALGIRAELGGLSDLSREALETAFRVVSRDSEFADAALEIVEVRGRLRCDPCGIEGPPEDFELEEAHPRPPWLCPTCGYLLRAVEGQGVRFAGLIVPDSNAAEVNVR